MAIDQSMSVLIVADHEIRLRIVCDIACQGIVRVVAALKGTDAKMAEIVAEQHYGNALAARSAPLASGPQRPAAGMRQAEMDYLLARSLG